MIHLELARRDRRWTQAQLAAVTRIPQALISDMERQRCAPTPEQIKKLADALGIPPELVTAPVVVKREATR